MNTVVLDVEAIGVPPAGHLEACVEMATGGREPMPVHDYLALSPWLATVVCVGAQSSTQGLISTAGMCEVNLLEWTNRALDGVDRIVTFNGRGYDLPLLMTRMRRYSIRPAKVLLQAFHESRQAFSASYDVMDRLSGCGATRPPSLRAASIAILGRDPKAFGDGTNVASLVTQERWLDLQTYCIGDVRVTADLYTILEPDNKLDEDGKIELVDGVACWAFGKHRGKPVSSTPEYASWVLRGEFSKDTKRVVREHM